MPTMEELEAVEEQALAEAKQAWVPLRQNFEKEQQQIDLLQSDLTSRKEAARRATWVKVREIRKQMGDE